MSISVVLPQMGESVTEGTIIRWLKQEGESVREDEPLVEISTDKIDTELPAPASGVLAKIIIGPDQTVDVGTELGVIEAGDGAAAASAPEAAPEAAPPAEQQSPEEPEQAAPASPQAAPAPSPATATPPAPSPATAPPPRAPATAAEPTATRATSPLVRKLARELDLDLGAVTGSGSGGRITKEDVLAAARTGRSRPRAKAAEPTPSRYGVPGEEHTDVAFDRVRVAIAEHMRRSRSTAAHVTNIVEVDMSDIAELRERAKDGFRHAEGVGLTFMPFIARAAVSALRTYPEFNAHVLDDGTTARLFRAINLGIAVGRDEGLIVPVVHDAETLSLTGLARAIADVGERARAKGRLTPNDVAGGTFTITNYGSIGGLMDTPIINQPQVAILGVGAIVKRPAVVSVDGLDAVAIRHQMFLSLSYDHRWIDGHQAARFNALMKHTLETTDFAALLGS